MIEEFELVSMSEKILVHNAEGYCSHEFCGKKPKYFAKLKVLGLPMLIVLCERHASEFDENWLTLRVDKKRRWGGD